MSSIPHTYNLRSSALTYFKRRIVSRTERQHQLVVTISRSVPIFTLKGVDNDNKNVTRIGRVSGSRNIELGLSRWILDYLLDQPTCYDRLFRRLFGVTKVLFNHIPEELCHEFAERWMTLTNAGENSCFLSPITVLVSLN